VFYRCLGSGCIFSDIHFTYRLGISTISKIVNEVSGAIWQTLREECMPYSSEDKWLEIANGFEKQANFPYCIGAVDGKHMRIIKAVDSGSLFYNYENYFSILL
jgi:hypothetical protein